MIYFVVPDINYQDLTLLMDESHELWCNIGGNADSHMLLTGFWEKAGLRYFGEIYHIIFSDFNVYKMITNDEKNKSKLFNILAAEDYKDKKIYSHQIELSENANEYIAYYRGSAKNIRYYRYLGAQKEADFIYKQFRIDDVISDYDRKRELLKGFCEVSNSITTNKNSKILNCIGILFTFIAGWDRLSTISHILFDNEKTLAWNIEMIIPIIVLFIIIGIIVNIIAPLVIYANSALEN